MFHLSIEILRCLIISFDISNIDLRVKRVIAALSKMHVELYFVFFGIVMLPGMLRLSN